MSLPCELRTAALVAAVLVFVGCGSSATTPPGAVVTRSNAVASTAPATSQARPAKESIGEVVGTQPGTVAVEVGTHGAGFAVVFCQDMGNGELSVNSGPMADGDLFVLVFRSDRTVSSLHGALRGVTWEVAQDPQGIFNADGSGAFSGKDAISGADVSGTFVCP